MKKLTLAQKLDRKLAKVRLAHPDKPDLWLKLAVFLDVHPDKLFTRK